MKLLTVWEHRSSRPPGGHSLVDRTNEMLLFPPMIATVSISTGQSRMRGCLVSSCDASMLKLTALLPHLEETGDSAEVLIT